MTDQHDWLDDDDLVETIVRAGSVAKGAAVLGVPRSSLTSRIGKQGLNERVRQGLAERNLQVVTETVPKTGRDHVTSDDPAEWGDIEALLKSRGLNPADWIVVRVRVNEWGENSDGDPLKQLRVDLVPSALDALMPARVDGWRPPARIPVAPKQDAELVVFFGDHHAPHHDAGLHAAACEWLRKNKPGRGVICGDLLDYDTLSRHRHNPRWSRTAQECVDAAYGVLRGYVQASPSTRWQLLSGNHEDRMRNAAIDQLLGVHGLTQAVEPGEMRGHAVLSVSHLLRLDELGIEWVGGDDEYSHAQVKVSPHLAARHGWISRKGSGASAIATLDSLRYSVFIGHCHRQAMVFHTAHDIDGTPKELVGVEIGTMAEIRGGLGYVAGGVPNWQQGFATARIWPDGFFSADLAKYVGGSLVWANQRYCPAGGPAPEPLAPALAVA
jgi:hypothetical protein